MKIKTKLINHLTLNGKKETSEKNLLKSVKELQKNSTKRFSKVFQLALIHSTPIFKLHKIKLKKRKKVKITGFERYLDFLKTRTSRISLALKFILKNSKKNIEYFSQSQSLSKEILICSKNKGESVKTKSELQKNVLAKKHFFRYYRWK
uniref:Ribosomal protein S7 n=1 Tax=Fistulifera solaris TaxID=1519565 RepID=A0A0U2L294_FISSO|nr:ribosomal protein S7 [Fistulifera solaris]ALG35776.1 ribosomal protein S7 [Fistulifera solaris]